MGVVDWPRAAEGLSAMDSSKRSSAHGSGWSGWTGADGAPDAFGCHRQIAETDTSEARQRIGDGRAHWNQRPLAGALGAKGSAAVAVLDEAAFQRGRDVVGARHPIDEGRPVQEMSISIRHFL